MDRMIMDAMGGMGRTGGTGMGGMMLWMLIWGWSVSRCWS
jgi:hypothetical protein